MESPAPVQTSVVARSSSGYLTTGQCDITEFAALVSQVPDLADTPHASSIEQRVPVYRCDELRAALATGPSTRHAVMAELARVFLDGPGIAVFAGALESAVVDAASEAFRAMIADQHARGVLAGDHYAKPGANDRIWNALEKLALAAPEAFVDVLRQQRHRPGLRGVAGPLVSGHVAGQRREPRGRGPEPASRLPPGFPVRCRR